MQFAAAFRVLGLLLMLFSLSLVPPIGISLWFRDGNLMAFIDTLVFTLIAGILIWLPTRNASRELRTRDGFFIVTLMWAGMSAFAALPFLLTPELSASYTDAFFEAMSGLSTTGASAFSGLDKLPESVLWYRQQLNFIGGGGVIVLAIAVLPMLGIGGMSLFRAESAGPMKDSKLTPRIKETAKALWIVYVGLTVLCALAYWWAGMTLFDAVGHAFSTVGTAGFSTHDASFGFWNDLNIELICMFFMLLGSLNFGLHFLAWRHVHKGRPAFGLYWNDPEFRFFISFVLGMITLVTIGLTLHGAYPTWSESLRYAAFNTFSLITSTGFLTADFAQWPSYVPWLLVFAFFFGGCAGSTTGGIKAIRFLLLTRQGVREFQRLIHPNGVFLVKVGDAVVSDRVAEAVWSFISLYILVTLVLTLLVMATGVPFEVAFSGIAASINNTGPGLGVLSSNVSSMNDTATWLMSFAMLVGRLEVFTVLILLTPMFWRR